jgi:signal transduction histidine kinase
MTGPASSTTDRGILAATRRHQSVRTWFLAIVSSMVVLVVVFAVIGSALLDRTAVASDNLVGHLDPATTQLAGMEAALVDEETGVRGYILTGKPEFLQPYEQGQPVEQQAFAALNRSLEGHGRALADTAAIQRAATEWRDDYAEPFIDVTRSGGHVSAAQLASSKSAFDRLRFVFAGARQQLDAEHASATTTLLHARRTRDWAFAGMLAAFLLTAVALTILLHVTVLRPLRVLRAAIHTVVAGHFDEPLPVSGPADIRALGKDVDAMRGRLADALDEAARKHEALTNQTVELQRSNSELEQFAYVASHDLQEPLRKVASFCQLLERRYGDHLDDRGRQYIDFAVDGAKRMQILINDLLNFSRVGRVNDARITVDLGARARDAIGDLHAAIEGSDAHIELPAHLPTITGDPTLVGMLWQNLFGNAIKFRQPDRSPRVVVEVTPHPEEVGIVQISVTDNGIGIPPQFAEKVFVIFQRLHGRDAYQGTGIGLALCKKIVEYHGGRIWVDTGHTGGTRIRFTLPTQPSEPQPAPTVLPATELEGSPS